jgi:nitrite reductase (NO-forming)
VPIVLVIVIIIIIANKNPKIEVTKEIENTNSLQSTTSAVSPEPQMPDTSVSATSKEVSFTVNGGNFYFKPNIIKAKLGDVVSLKFKNDEGFHNLIIDEFKVATQNIKSGAEETITFTASKKGSFEYYCSVGTHRQMGMKGTLIVE